MKCCSGSFVILLLSLVFQHYSDNVFACTIFTVTRDSKTFIGANEDWKTDRFVMGVVPPGKSTNGYISFGVDDPFEYVFFGINQHGLFFDLASVNNCTSVATDPLKRTANNPVYLEMLANCSSTAEAIDFLNQYNLTGLKRHHIMVVDRSGTSAIIEWGRGEVSVIPATEQHQIMTNFNQNCSEGSNSARADRYSLVDTMLRPAEQVEPEFLRTILNRVKLQSRYFTVLSSIYDLNALSIHIYFRQNFQEHFLVDIETEIENGEQVIPLPEVFSDLELIEPADGIHLEKTDVSFEWRGKATDYFLDISTSPDFLESETRRFKFSEESDWKGSSFCFLLFIGTFSLAAFRPLRYRLAIFVLVLLLLLAPQCTIRTERVRNSHSVVQLENNSTYYWKVSAVKKNDRITESVTRKLQTGF